MLNFAEDGKSALEGSRPGMVVVVGFNGLDPRSRYYTLVMCDVVVKPWGTAFRHARDSLMIVGMPVAYVSRLVPFDKQAPSKMTGVPATRIQSLLFWFIWM